MRNDTLNSIIKIIDQITDKTGRFGSWCSLIMVVVMVLVVILRYGFQFGSIALQESVMYLNCVIFTFGVAFTL